MKTVYKWGMIKHVMVNFVMEFMEIYQMWIK